MKNQILNFAKFKILLLLCALLLGVGCNKTTPIPTFASLKVDRVSVKFRNSYTEVVRIDYNGEWYAELSDDSWCSLDKTSGTGSGELTITAKERTSTGRNLSTLTIISKSNPELSETVKLSLDGLDFIVDPANIEFGLGEQFVDVDVEYEGEWKASIDDLSWLSMDKTSGTGKTTIRVTNKDLMTNHTGKTGKLTITLVDYPGVSTVVNLKQLSTFRHGSYLTLNKATKGKGIDIVIIGDGFSESEMGLNGHWYKVAAKTKEVLFSIEPYKSYLDHFNVYMVNAVSASNTIGVGIGGSNTFFKTYKDAATGNLLYMEDGKKGTDFAFENSPVKDDKGKSEDMFLCVMVNDPSFRGAANITDKGGRYLGTIFDMGEAFGKLVTHEFTHAFGKLADEYVYSGPQFGYIPQADVNTYKLAKSAFGYYQNIEFTSDKRAFSNQNWRKLLDLNYPGVGVHEGGFYYRNGAWRSEIFGLMGSDSNGKLGPVNREIVLRQIYKLAGRATEYTFQTFIDYDKKNIQ